MAALRSHFTRLTAATVLFAFLVSVGGPETRIYDPQNVFSLGLHELLGLLVFGLTLARLAWRAFTPTPPELQMPRWMSLSSRGAHWALYALLVLTPVTAIAGAWLEGHALIPLWFGSIGPFGTASHATGALLADIHGLLGDAIMWIAGLHAAAAIYHHVVLRDQVLVRMLPALRRP